MDIEKALLEEHSKVNTLRITDYIGNDEQRFATLMTIFFDKGYRLNQRAAWVLYFCWENQPQLVEPYLEKMVMLLGEQTHPALKRNILRIFQSQFIPEKLHGHLLNFAFNLLVDRNEPVAIRVFSMTVLDNLSGIYPDIKQELMAYLQEEIEFGSAGFKSRARKILKRLEKKRPA